MNCELMLTYDTPAYMFNVYKNQLSWQTGSRNLTGPKMLLTIWHTYMKLVTKYQIYAINSCWEKCYEKYLGTDGRTEVKQYTRLRWSGGIIIFRVYMCIYYKWENWNIRSPFFSSRIFIKTDNLLQSSTINTEVPVQTCWSFYQV